MLKGLSLNQFTATNNDNINSEIKKYWATNKNKQKSEMSLAIANEEFIHNYQPIVDRNEKIIKIEVLTRWQSSLHGLISPEFFIPIAEQNGLIVDLCYYSLKKSCRQLHDWQDEGFHDLKIAVNISPVQFNENDLVSNIKNIISLTGIDARCLEVEITENEKIENAIDDINALSEMGVSISIDDFGIGYSSLSRLKDYPIDTLKIDKSLVKNLSENEKSLIIVSSIIEMAHHLGCNIVAEGVETSKQFELLKSLGCDYFQGFYFYKPLILKEVQNVLNSQSKIFDTIQ